MTARVYNCNPISDSRYSWCVSSLCWSSARVTRKRSSEKNIVWQILWAFIHWPRPHAICTVPFQSSKLLGNYTNIICMSMVHSTQPCDFCVDMHCRFLQHNQPQVNNNAISNNLFVPIAHAATLINPRCVCAARVAVLGQSVYLSVRCFSGTTGYYLANELHERLQSNKVMGIKMVIWRWKILEGHSNGWSGATGGDFLNCLTLCTAFC